MSVLRESKFSGGKDYRRNLPPRVTQRTCGTCGGLGSVSDPISWKFFTCPKCWGLGIEQGAI